DDVSHGVLFARRATLRREGYSPENPIALTAIKRGGGSTGTQNRRLPPAPRANAGDAGRREAAARLLPAAQSPHHHGEAGYVKQQLRDKLIEHREYIREHRAW
ncbi:MAG: hypothetical protein ACREVO_15325, partial [Steroidobacteraceae bacterium]